MALFNNYCCGLPLYTYGDIEGARRIARINLKRWQKYKDSSPIIVTDCSSCASFLKEYPKLFAGTPDEATAVSFACQVRDIVEVLAESFRSGNLKLKTTFHYPCHLSRYQNDIQSIKKIMQRIEGLSYREMDDPTSCCGAAGTYFITHMCQSKAILANKIKDIRSINAEMVVTSCPMCLLQLRLGVSQSGLNIKVMHIVQMIDWAQGDVKNGTC